jgi:hypothetical protein
MEIQQLESKFGLWKNISFDSATRADKECIDRWRQTLHRACDREPRIEMTTSPATGEQYAHLRAT